MRRIGAFLCTCLWMSSVSAGDFSWWGVDGTLTFRVAGGAAVRVEGRDNRLIGKLSVPGQQDLCAVDDCQSQQGDPGPNQRLVDAVGAFSGSNEDNGNLNYDRGDITAAVIHVRPKLELFWNEWKFTASGTVFYDTVNANFDEHHVDTRFQPARTPRGHEPESIFANGSRLGMLSINRSFSIEGHELLINIGNQVLNWGEANLVQFNTLSEWCPLDAPMLAFPGSEPSQLQRAVPLAVASITLSDSVTLEGVYQLAWRGAILPASGSFLSFNDVAAGGRYAMVGFSNLSEDPNRQYSPPGLAGTISQSTRTLYVPNNNFARPRDSGQFGARMAYLADWLNNGTELTLHYMHYHNRYPILSAYAAQDSCTRSATAPGFAGAFAACQGFNSPQNPTGLEPLPVDTTIPFLDYVEDIDLMGVSFNTNLGDWAFSGEYAFRPNQPLQVLQSDVLFAALGPAFPAQDINIGSGSATDTLPSPQNPAQVAALDNIMQTISASGGSGFTIPGEQSAIPDLITAYRHQTVVGGQLIRGYERMKVSQVTMTGIRTFSSNPFGASQIIWIIEGGATYVHNMPPGSQLRFEGSGDRTHPSPGADGTGTPDGQPDSRRANPTQMRRGFGSALSYGYRSAVRLTYDGLPGGVSLYPTFLWFHDIKGYSPAPMFNFIEGRQVLISNLSAEFKSNVTLGVSYQRFAGGGTNNRLRDRDNVSVYAAYVF